MKKYIILVVVLVIILIAFLYVPYMGNAKEIKYIVGIGDSIMAHENSYIKDHKGWEIFNLAVPGSTSRDWVDVRNTEAEVCVKDPSLTMAICRGGFDLIDTITITPDVVIIQLGTNDSTGFFEPAPTTADDYENNISKLISSLRLKWPKTKVLLVQPPRIIGASKNVDLLLDSFRSRLETIANEEKNTFIGLDLLPTPFSMFGDNIHPNQNGHEWAKKRIKCSLRNLNRIEKRGSIQASVKATKCLGKISI